MPVSGGSPSIICEVPTDFGSGTWGPDDTIAFATWGPGTGLFRVPAGGDKVEILTLPRGDQGETGHSSPHFLPGGGHMLFTALGTALNRTAVLTLKTREWKTLDIPHNARYVATGHLIYHDSGKLFAQRFDLAGMTLIGSPVSVVEDVYRPYQGLKSGYTGAASAYFDISDTGDLLYLPTGTSRDGPELVWINKKRGNYSGIWRQ